MNEPHPVELDGSHGEGGGQILRSSLALSLLTGKPFHLHNVRAGRSRPGLQPQHLMSVQAAGAIGQAKLRGATRGSTDLSFEPGAVVAGKYHFPIGTAGATSLVLHTLYLPLALSGRQTSEVLKASEVSGPSGSVSDITIEGGTHVSTSPCYHFLETTWLGYLELLGLKIKLDMRRPGFYPRGGGLVQAHIAACDRIEGLGNLEVKAATRVTGFSAVAGLPEHIAHRQAQHAAKRLKKELRLEVDLREETWEGGPGTVLALILDTQPVPTLFFALGERGKPAERVADEAVSQAVRFHQAKTPGVDEHSADQLLLPLTFAAGPSEFPVTEVTSHLVTNAFVIGRFLDRIIRIEGNEGGPGRVHIEQLDATGPGV